MFIPNYSLGFFQQVLKPKPPTCGNSSFERIYLLWPLHRNLAGTSLQTFLIFLNLPKLKLIYLRNHIPDFFHRSVI